MFRITVIVLSYTKTENKAIFREKKNCLEIRGTFQYISTKAGENGCKSFSKVVKQFEGKKIYNHEMSRASFGYLQSIGQ